MEKDIENIRTGVDMAVKIDSTEKNISMKNHPRKKQQKQKTTTVRDITIFNRQTVQCFWEHQRFGVPSETGVYQGLHNGHENSENC